ncbi:hypothetical protein OCU04_004370 [Sclerotinia nivalis]|uniref:Uncharacterized protein n=1 Tax=Sclerotinia nivalis TaxID=352851 RepID=A0A9X0DKJ6_9HELO|nr:hypothetical protein OCU04_004370 [Sclerotinia nivalis]
MTLGPQQEGRTILVIEATFQVNNIPTKLRCLIDSGAQANIIQQSKCIEWDWIPNPGKGTPLVSASGMSIPSYGDHQFTVEVLDDSKEKRTHTHRFTAATLDLPEIDAILGLP